MKRREFIAASSVLGLSEGASVWAKAPAAEKEVYEWRAYELKMGGMGRLEGYLQNALIPALNRLGVTKIGVFKELGKDEPAKLHVLTVYPSQNSFFQVKAQLKTDAELLKTAESYHQTPVDKAIYDRMSSSLMVAFDGMPQLAVPAKEPRLLELRTYEGYSEDAVRRKIKMFNDSEMTIFKKTQLHMVFFGEVVIGPRMPCLTYMLTFKNMEERNANWTQFSADPDWKQVAQAAEYANTVSRIERIFLEPTSYSSI